MSGQFVQADPGLCISCNSCMAGCLNKHSVPGDYPKARLNVVQTLTVSAPIACHHCVDAPCVRACPEGALYYEGDRVAIKQENCIGCRNCVQACPFGAVEVVPIEQHETLGNLKLAGQKKSFLIKCDLCYDRPNGPACVEACPTTALRLVDRAEIEGGKEVRRRVEVMNTAPIDDTGIFELVNCFAVLDETNRTKVIACATELTVQEGKGDSQTDALRESAAATYGLSANINLLINKFARLSDEGRKKVIECAHSCE